MRGYWRLNEAMQGTWASRGCLRLTSGLDGGYLAQKSKQNCIIFDFDENNELLTVIWSPAAGALLLPDGLPPSQAAVGAVNLVAYGAGILEIPVLGQYTSGNDFRAFSMVLNDLSAFKTYI